MRETIKCTLLGANFEEVQRILIIDDIIDSGSTILGAF